MTAQEIIDLFRRKGTPPGTPDYTTEIDSDVLYAAAVEIERLRERCARLTRGRSMIRHEPSDDCWCRVCTRRLIEANRRYFNSWLRQARKAHDQYLDEKYGGQGADSEI